MTIAKELPWIGSFFVSQQINNPEGPLLIKKIGDNGYLVVYRALALGGRFYERGGLSCLAIVNAESHGAYNPPPDKSSIYNMFQVNPDRFVCGKVTLGGFVCNHDHQNRLAPLLDELLSWVENYMLSTRYGFIDAVFVKNGGGKTEFNNKALFAAISRAKWQTDGVLFTNPNTSHNLMTVYKYLSGTYPNSGEMIKTLPTPPPPEKPKPVAKPLQKKVDNVYVRNYSLSA